MNSKMYHETRDDRPFPINRFGDRETQKCICKSKGTVEIPNLGTRIHEKIIRNAG